jgi:hypothetical protein
VRHDAGYFREEPGAGKPPARICEGGAKWPSYSTTTTLTRIGAISVELECFGYLSVGQRCGHQGIVTDGKKLRHLMWEHDIQPKQPRRYVATTDSDIAGPSSSTRPRMSCPTTRSSYGSLIRPRSPIQAASDTRPPSLRPGPVR